MASKRQVQNFKMLMAGEPDGVALKREPVHLLQSHIVLHQDASDSGDADSIYAFEYLPIFKCLILILFRLSGQRPSKSSQPPKSLFCHPK